MIVEHYVTKDKTAVKYVHEDGSETTIKKISGCQEFKNHLTGETETIVDNNKYVVFVSTSVGCPVGCKFCYLTLKRYPYIRLKDYEVENNVKEAINHFVGVVDPSAADRYIKISFMGMGDLFLDIKKIFLAEKIIRWATDQQFYAKGFDGVDISTTFPKKVNINWLGSVIKESDDYLTKFQPVPRNPLSTNRNIYRIFYSLHTFDTNLRKQLIPFSRNPDIDIMDLQLLEESYPVDLLFHHMFMAGINDDDSDIYDDLIRNYMFNDLSKNEFRFLRLNQCDLSKIRPTSEKDLHEIYGILNQHINKMKVQYSAGSEIQAACGQFIMRDFISK